MERVEYANWAAKFRGRFGFSITDWPPDPVGQPASSSLLSEALKVAGDSWFEKG